VQTTRLGTLFVWQTAGATCQPDQWRKFRHDEWNTGTYGADTRRPARIDDLRFSISGTSAKLTWTAPGDADHARQLRERDTDRDRAAGGRGLGRDAHLHTARRSALLRPAHRRRGREQGADRERRRPRSPPGAHAAAGRRA